MEGGTVIQGSAPMFQSHCLPDPKILPLLVTPCKAVLVACANGKFQCNVGISPLCLMAVSSSCWVSLVDSLGRLDGGQQHWHHQHCVPDSSLPIRLVVQGIKRSITLLPEKEMPQQCFLLGKCFQGRQKQKPGLSRATTQNILTVQRGCCFYCPLSKETIQSRMLLAHTREKKNHVCAS